MDWMCLGVEALADRDQEGCQCQVLSRASQEAQHKTREENSFMMSLPFWASGLIQGLAQLPAVTPSVAIAHGYCPQLPTSCYATQNSSAQSTPGSSLFFSLHVPFIRHSDAERLNWNEEVTSWMNGINSYLMHFKNIQFSLADLKWSDILF